MEERDLRGSTNPAVDGPWAWLLLVGSFMLQAVLFGTTYAVGVFYVEWLEVFQQGRSSTAWIGSVNTGILFLSGPLTAILINRFGHRFVTLLGSFLATLGIVCSAYASSIYVLYVMYGVVAGFGYSCLYLPCIVILDQYFRKNRNLAIGISVTGSGVGTLIMPVLLQRLVDSYSWRTAMVITGGIMLQTSAVFGVLLRPVDYWIPASRRRLQQQQQQQNDLKQGEDDEPPSTSSYFDTALLTDPALLILTLNNFLWGAGVMVFFANIIDYAVIVGITLERASYIVSVMGICGTVGRALCGAIVNHQLVSPYWMYLVGVLVAGATICALPLHPVFPVLVALGAVFGTFYGCFITMLPMVTADLFGSQKLSAAFGCIISGCGLGTLLGPPLAGWLSDVFGDYQIAFFVVGGIFLVSGVILLPIPVLQKRRRTDEENMTVFVQTPDEEKGMLCKATSGEGIGEV